MLNVSADIFDLSDDAVLLCAQNRVVYSNPAAERLLGADCVGQKLAALLGEEFTQSDSAAFVGSLVRDGIEYKLSFKKYNGLKAIFISPMTVGSELVNDAFIFSLRQDLMNLHIGLDALRDVCGSPEAAAPISLLTRSSFRLSRLLSNLNLVRGSDDNSPEFIPRRFDASQYLFELLDTLELLCPEISFHGDTGSCLMLDGDPVLFENIVLNLVSNCILHAEGCTRIVIRLTELGDKLMLAVADNGQGMDEKELSGAFEAYKKLRSLNELGKGAGFGLSAVRTAAKLHGGTVMLESTIGRGTCVRVSLRRSMSKGSSVHGLSEKYSTALNSVLTGLADCLDDKCFSSAYLD